MGYIRFCIPDTSNKSMLTVFYYNTDYVYYVLLSSLDSVALLGDECVGLKRDDHETFDYYNCQYVLLLTES